MHPRTQVCVKEQMAALCHQTSFGREQFGRSRNSRQWLSLLGDAPGRGSAITDLGCTERIDARRRRIAGRIFSSVVIVILTQKSKIELGTKCRGPAGGVANAGTARKNSKSLTERLLGAVGENDVLPLCLIDEQSWLSSNSNHATGRSVFHRGDPSP